MGGAVRAGIMLTLLAGFLPSSSSLLAPVQSPKGTHGGISLLLVAFSLLLIVKTEGDNFFSFFNSAPCLADAFTKQTVESIQAPVPHICPGAVPSPIIHGFCTWLDSSPAFTLQMQGDKVQQGYSAVTVGWEWHGKGGRDTECTGRLAGQNVAAGSSTAQGPGQAREWFVPSFGVYRLSMIEGWSPPLQSSTKMCSVLLFSA